MVVYIRGANLSNYNQELVRADLLQMIIDGQNRGESITQVMGENYKEVCDEIIEALPKRTGKQIVIESTGLFLQTVWILGIISFLRQLITNHDTPFLNQTFVVTVGDLISAIIIGCAAILIASFICKKAFEESQNSRSIKTFVRYYCIALLFLGIILLVQFFGSLVLITLPMWGGILAIVVLFAGSKILDYFV